MTPVVPLIRHLFQYTIYYSNNYPLKYQAKFVADNILFWVFFVRFFFFPRENESICLMWIIIYTKKQTKKKQHFKMSEHCHCDWHFKR